MDRQKPVQLQLRTRISPVIGLKVDLIVDLFLTVIFDLLFALIVDLSVNRLTDLRSADFEVFVHLAKMFWGGIRFFGTRVVNGQCSCDSNLPFKDVRPEDATLSFIQI